MHTLKKNITLFILLMLSLDAISQTSITVNTYTKDNDEVAPFVFVNVYTVPGDHKTGSTLTDENGHAIITVDSFPVIIEATGVGYEMDRITLVNANTTTVKFQLSKTSSTLHEVVVTGVLTPVKPSDAFANYKIINASTMQAMGANNVQDALGYQLNTFTQNDGVLGSKLTMQGLQGGNNVKILMDGVPVNGRENGNIDLSQLTTYNVDRIEIIQGPMSVVYGTDAMGGVINIITKNSKQKWGINGQLYYETVGKYNYNASVNRSFGKHHFTLGGGRNYFQGWGVKSDDTASFGPHRTSLFLPKEQYLGNFSYRFHPSEKFDLRFASDFVKEKMTNRGIAFITPFQGRALDDYYRVTRSLNRLTVNGKLGISGKYQLTNGYSLYYRTKNTFNKDLVTLDQNLITTDGSQDTSTYNDFTFRGMYENKLFKKLDYTVGYDVLLQNAFTKKIDAGSAYINDYALFTNLSLPLLNEKLNIQGGLRASHNTAYKTPFIPSLNILYKAGNNIRIRASYAKAFRAPSLKELYLDFVDVNHRVFGNQNLRSEIGDHVQASASWMVFEKSSNYAQVLLTGYYNSVHDQIALAQRYPGSNGDSTLYYDYTNILAFRNFFATLEFEGQYSNFHYKIGYSYNYTFGQSGEFDAFDFHEGIITLQYYWKLLKLNMAAFNRINGARPFLISNIDGTSSYQGRQPVYDITDITFSRKFWKQHLQLTAGVKNVFDVKGFSSGTAGGSVHSGSGAVVLMPRSFFTSFSFNFD